MTQMRFAGSTSNFNAPSIRISCFYNRPFYLLIKAWPAAVRRKLIRREIKRSITLLTNKNTLFLKRLIKPSIGWLCVTMKKNLLFFRC